MNAATKKILEDLKKSGFDTSSIENQAQVNPLLDRAADSVLGGGVLRREEYTKYKATKDTEVEQLQNQVRELAAAHDSLDSFKGNDELYKAALETIVEMENTMIANGFEPAEVKALSFNRQTELKNVIGQARAKEETPKVEDREMPDNDKFVDTDMFQTVLANAIGGNMISTVRIQRALQKADKLGIEITPELERSFEQNLLKGAESQKSFERIADETFGFSAKEKEIADKQQQETINAKVQEQLAEKLREAGVNPSSVRGTRPKSIMDNYNGRLGSAADADNVLTGEGGTVVVRGRKLPANKHGDPEYYKLRGDKSTRVQHAISSMEELEGKRPELFEEPY